MFKLEKLEKVLGTDITNKLRLALNGEVPIDPGDEQPEGTEQDFATTTDGVTISGSIAEGSKVFMQDAEGNKSEVPDGTYTLDNGKVITCSGSTITAVSEAEDEEKKEEEVMTSEKVLTAIQSALSTQSEELTSSFTSKIDEINTKHENDLKEITSKFSAVIEAMEAMATINSPAPSHKEDPKQKFSEKRATAFSSLLKSIDTIKK